MESLILPAQLRPPPPANCPTNPNPNPNPNPSPKPALSFSKPDTHLLHLIKSGRTHDSLAALDAIAGRGLKVSSKTYSELLDYCIESNSLHLGRELHGRVGVVDGVDPFVETKLIGMYAKCGSLVDARKVFDEMSERNLYAWSAVIGGYSREHRWGEVLGLFGMMMGEGMVVPDHFLVPKILEACGNCGEYEAVRLVHSIVVRAGLGCFTYVNNAVISAYAKCGWLSLAWTVFEGMDERNLVSWNSIIYAYCHAGKIEEAGRLFDRMRGEGIEPGLQTWNVLIAGHCQSGDCDAAIKLKKGMEGAGVTPDVFTWTSLISGLAKNNREFEALGHFVEMLFLGVQPTGVTIVSVVSACASLKALKNGKEVHSFVSKMEFAETVLVGNSLVDLYSKCGELESSRQVFDRMFQRDSCTWNAMISGYCRDGFFGEAYSLFLKMQESGLKPSAITWNLIISAYIRNGNEDQALDLFQKMGKSGITKPDTSTWNSLISGFLQTGDKNKAFRIFRKMQSLGVRPNSVTILTILDACGNLVAANKVREIHTCTLRRNLVSEIAVSNCLIDSYAKSGNIVYSRALFDMMPSKDIITWNSLISGYVFHGCSSDARNAFDQMKSDGHSPNGITLLSLLKAYSLVNMVEKGKLLYSSMKEGYHILPRNEHRSAMVDLLGRAGRLHEAVEFIEQMTSDPDSSIWQALLTASRAHGNVLMTIHAGERLLKLNPGDNATRQLVTRAYRISRRGGSAALEDRTPYKSISKLRGRSLVEDKNKVYSFETGDQSSPTFGSTYNWLRSIPRNIIQSDLGGVYGIEEEDNEEICGIHSEKLALGFALNDTAYSTRPIRVVKNFRICRDCHSTFKFVSSSCGCEICLTDTRCLHHFKNGRCSCGDYW